MARKTNSSVFIDTAPVLRAAATSDSGIRFRVSSWPKAVNFRQRCYRYRTALREEDAQRMLHVPGYLPSTPYDTLEILIETPAGEPFTASCPPELRDRPYDVVIRHKAPTGQLLDADGKPLSLHDEQQLPHLDLDLE